VPNAANIAAQLEHHQLFVAAGAKQMAKGNEEVNCSAP